MGSNQFRFLNQACTGQRPAHDWFLKIAIVRDVSMLVCVCVCVCVCVYVCACTSHTSNTAFFLPFPFDFMAAAFLTLSSYIHKKQLTKHFTLKYFIIHTHTYRRIHTF